jgi:putative transposase
MLGFLLPQAVFKTPGGSMKKNFTNEQIIYTLRQAEAGTPALELCRKIGITEQTFYRWKKKFASRGVAELARLRQLGCTSC